MEGPSVVDLSQVGCEVAQGDAVLAHDAPCLPAVLAIFLVRCHLLVILHVCHKDAGDEPALFEWQF